ncbi:hypothetical protein XI00_05635 [Bradyrhizobium sp. CCBAU 21359]|nr:hypothetical protein [Bradyrhizobium sp. CCBAU 21359]
MPQGSILLVHGTGVRLGNYEKSLEVAEKTASEGSLGRNLFPVLGETRSGLNSKGFLFWMFRLRKSSSRRKKISLSGSGS